MPASMISAPTGGRPKVIGSSIAMVASGPRPGSTPTSVPTRAPIRHSKTFHGLRATPKPRTRLWKRSIIEAALERVSFLRNRNTLSFCFFGACSYRRTVSTSPEHALAEAQQRFPAEIGRPQLERQAEPEHEQQHAERGQH